MKYVQQYFFRKEGKLLHSHSLHTFVCMCVTRSFDTFLTCLLRSKLLINSLFVAPACPADVVLLPTYLPVKLLCWQSLVMRVQLVSADVQRAGPSRALSGHTASSKAPDPDTYTELCQALAQLCYTHTQHRIMSSFYSSPWRRIMKSYYSNQFLLQLRGESEYMTWIHFPLKLNLSLINTE